MRPLQGLGLEYAKRLVAAGCKCVVLTGRAPALPPATLAEFAAAGASVFCVSADAGEATAWAAVLKWAHERLPQVQHFGHAAGITAFDLLQVGTPQLSASALSQTDTHTNCCTCCLPLHVFSLMELLPSFLKKQIVDCC